jgi:heme/copper-type cytochrome/quinol oxidase subunit 2
MHIAVAKAQARETEARQREASALLVAVVALVVAGVCGTMAMVFREQRDDAREECRK